MIVLKNSEKNHQYNTEWNLLFIWLLNFYNQHIRPIRTQISTIIISSRVLVASVSTGYHSSCLNQRALRIYSCCLCLELEKFFLQKQSFAIPRVIQDKNFEYLGDFQFDILNCLVLFFGCTIPSADTSI